MLRVLLGIVKGALIGGAVGYGASRIGLGGSGYLIYAAVGFLVGVVCGKALWKQETLWTPLLKGLFGSVVLCGLYWGASKLMGGLRVPLPAVLGAGDHPLVDVPQVLAPALAIIYGVFVEVDDGGKTPAASTPPAPRPS